MWGWGFIDSHKDLDSFRESYIWGLVTGKTLSRGTCDSQPETSNLDANSVRIQVALVVKNPPGNAGDTRDVGSIPGSGKSPGGGNGNPLQYFCLGVPWTEAP